MLVLSRRNAESVIVDGFNSPERVLKVTVLEIKGGRVRLGFEVNPNKPIHREAAWEQMRADVGTDRSNGGT